MNEMTMPRAAYAGLPSYYAASANPAPERNRLEGGISCQVCVVGGGFTGLSAALELAGRGYQVVLLEGERVGWGASGRNGGQLVNGYSRPLDVIERRYGTDAARGLGAWALDGARLIRERTARYGIACDLVDGGFMAAITRPHMAEMEEQARIWARFGHSGMQLVDKAGLGAIIASDRYLGGMFDPAGGHFHPLNFVLGEAAAFEALGGRIYENSRVTRIRSGGRPVAVTAEGSVTADTLVICGNAYLGNAVPSLSRRIMPVSSQIIATEPLGDLAGRLLPANACVEDARYILDYFRRSADGRLLYGGGSVYGGRDPASIINKIRPALIKTFPELANVGIDFAWSGNFALTLTRVPQIGRMAPGIYYSQGDSGHGVTTTQLLGHILAEAVAGEMERFDLFSSLPHPPFPGGQIFRAQLATLGSWYYRLRDWLGV